MTGIKAPAVRRVPNANPSKSPVSPAATIRLRSGHGLKEVLKKVTVSLGDRGCRTGRGPDAKIGRHRPPASINYSRGDPSRSASDRHGAGSASVQHHTIFRAKLGQSFRKAASAKKVLGDGEEK